MVASRKTDFIEHIVQGIAWTSSFEPLRSLSDDDWDGVVVTAIALGLAPLLHWHLSQAEVTVPPLALAKLAITRQAHAKRNEGIALQLAEILGACHQHQLDVLALKGALLAPTLYEEPGLRPMNDIDLLFQPSDLTKAGNVLESLGYIGKHKAADEGPGVTKHVSTYRRAGNQGATPNPYLSPGADRTIEPHGSLEESWFGLKVDMTPGVWDRAVPITLHDQPTYRLSMDDLLLHLIVHAVFHVIMGASVFVQLYDIAQVLAKRSDELDWPQFLTLAGRADAQPFAYAGLYWAKTVYKAPVPDAPLLELERACPSGLSSYIKSLDAAGLFKRTQHPPLITLGQRLQRGLADRRETARWAVSPRAKWQVWRTALAFYKTDTAAMLSKGLKGLSRQSANT
jgi:hypothetical protein